MASTRTEETKDQEIHTAPVADGNDRATTPPVPVAELAPTIGDANFFERIHAKLAKRLSSRTADEKVLLNIPIWGWTGDGKTCALLTAIHYCEPIEHGIGLALVTDTTDLAGMEAETEQYRGL